MFPTQTPYAQAPKFTKKHTRHDEKFGVKVDVYFHGSSAPLHINSIIGDGNCYWRAVAKQTKTSWHKLKKQTTKYMKLYAIEHSIMTKKCSAKPKGFRRRMHGPTC